MKLCDKNKKTQDDWKNSVKVKFKATDTKKNVTEYEKKTVEEMENNMEK